VRVNQQSALEIVKRYLSEQFEVPAADIRPEVHLFDDLGLDSVDALDLLGMLDKELSIPIIEEEVQKIRTVQDVVDYLIRHAAAA
jgi:acyl carrier protein